MKGLIFATRKDVEDFAAAVDKSLGYPVAGTNIGGGRHSPAEQSVTVRWDEPRTDGAQWIYPDTRGFEVAEDKDLPAEVVAAKKGAEVVTLAAKWDTADTVAVYDAKADTKPVDPAKEEDPVKAQAEEEVLP